MKLKKVGTSSKPVLKKPLIKATSSSTPTEEKSKIKSNNNVETPKKYKDLREVMDLTRNFSMMYSGVEDESNFQILYDMGIRNFLISFHYVQKKHLSIQKYEEMGVKFFVDSGRLSI